MKYVHGLKPEMEVKTAISILISSDFLQMAGLVDESLGYVSENLQEILLLPIDMNCMNSSLVKRLAGKVEIESLENLKDKKDKLKSKIFMKKLEILFQDNQNMLQRCAHCSQLFTSSQRRWQLCDKGQIFVDAHGELSCPHVADKTFDLNKFVLSMRSRKIPWRDLFWKLFACVIEFHCVTCDRKFTGNKLNQCDYHPKPFFCNYKDDKGL